MKAAPTWRETVTSSFIEMSTNQLVSGQIFKDDVNVFLLHLGYSLHDWDTPGGHKETPSILADQHEPSYMVPNAGGWGILWGISI
jgi:hypothetical protein